MTTLSKSSIAHAKPSSSHWASVRAAPSCCSAPRKPALFSMAAITVCRMTSSNLPSPFFRTAWSPARATLRFRENRRRPNPSSGRSSTPFAYLCESIHNSRAALGQSRPFRCSRFFPLRHGAGLCSAPCDLFRDGRGAGPSGSRHRLRAWRSARRGVGGGHARSGSRETHAPSLDRLQNGVPSYARGLDLYFGNLFGGCRCAEHRQQSALPHSRQSDRHYLDVRNSFFDHALWRRNALGVARAHFRGPTGPLSCRGAQRKTDVALVFASRRSRPRKKRSEER